MLQRRENLAMVMTFENDEEDEEAQVFLEKHDLELQCVTYSLL
jgi:hypothetical protein